MVLARERVEAEMVVRGVEAGLAAVAVDDLRPVVDAPVELERAVVLRAAHEVLGRLRRVDGQALELQRRQALVQADRLIRNHRQERLAGRQVSGVEVAAVAVRRGVDVLAVRTRESAVVAVDPLQRVARARDERVMVRMEPAVVVLVERQVVPGRARVGRHDQRAAVVLTVHAVVVVRAAEVQHVGRAERRVDHVVVPALRAGHERAAVAEALRRRDVRERRRAGRVVRAEDAGEVRRSDTRVAVADVHPRLTAGQHVERKRRAVRAVVRVQRSVDLRPRARIAVRSRAPHALLEARQVDR